jgi:hypothetical protein
MPPATQCRAGCALAAWDYSRRPAVYFRKTLASDPGSKGLNRWRTVCSKVLGPNAERGFHPAIRGTAYPSYAVADRTRRIVAITAAGRSSLRFSRKIVSEASSSIRSLARPWTVRHIRSFVLGNREWLRNVSAASAACQLHHSDGNYPTKSCGCSFGAVPLPPQTCTA